MASSKLITSHVVLSLAPCRRQVSMDDATNVYDKASEKTEPVCRRCGYRLIVLGPGFQYPYMHGFRRVV